MFYLLSSHSCRTNAKGVKVYKGFGRQFHQYSVHRKIKQHPFLFKLHHKSHIYAHHVHEDLMFMQTSTKGR